MRRIFGAQPDDPLPDLPELDDIPDTPEIDTEKACAPRKQPLSTLAYCAFPMDRLSGDSHKLPPSVDLRSLCPPIVEQGSLGACTSAVMAAAHHVLYPDEPDGSRLFLYYNEREADGNVNIDRGSTLALGVRSLIHQGICSETTWPYVETRFNQRPPSQAYREASASGQVNSVNVHLTEIDIKACLAAGNPAAVIIRVFQSFKETGTDGMVYMPDPGDVDLGYHCIQLCGYDDAKSVWIARNSWGAEWGDKGYFYMPYNYLLSGPVLSSSMHVLTKASRPGAILFALK